MTDMGCWHQTYGLIRDFTVEKVLTRQTFVLIPLTLLLPLRFGIMGVLLAGPVADFSAFMLSVVLVGIELKKQKNDM